MNIVNSFIINIRNIIPYIFLFLIVLFRFWIGATTEIVGSQYDTDGLAYLVRVGFWGHSQDPIRPPFFPLVGWAVMHTGFPFRLFLEITFLASATWLSLLLKREFGWLLAFSVLVAIVLNPYTIRSFTEAQREPILLILYILASGFTLSFLQNLCDGRVPYRATLLLSTNVSFIILTREGEEYFSFVILSALALTSTFFFRSVTIWKKLSLLVPIAVPMVTFLSIVSILNEEHFGVGGYRGLFSDEVRLLSQLNHIKSNDALRYAPVTNKTFQIAVENSPTFAEFGAPILRRDGFYELLREHSSTFVGAKEMDPTRTIWALNKALDEKYGPRGDIKAEKLQAASDELKKLIDSGKINSYSLHLPYPFDPNIDHWIGDLLSSTLMLLDNTVFITGDFGGLGVRSDFSPNNFNEAYNRRVDMVSQQFVGFPHRLREFFVTQYDKILIGLCIILLILPIKTCRISGNLWFFVILAYLGARTVVTSMLYTGVAPVSRYMVFSSPIFAICLLVFVTLLKASGTRWVNSCLMSFRASGRQRNRWKRATALFQRWGWIEDVRAV